MSISSLRGVDFLSTDALPLSLPTGKTFLLCSFLRADNTLHIKWLERIT